MDAESDERRSPYLPPPQLHHVDRGRAGAAAEDWGEGMRGWWWWGRMERDKNLLLLLLLLLLLRLFIPGRVNGRKCLSSLLSNPQNEEG